MIDGVTVRSRQIMLLTHKLALWTQRGFALVQTENNFNTSKLHIIQRGDFL